MLMLSSGLRQIVRASWREYNVPLPYRVGDLVPFSGIYHVAHGDHRLPHEITLLAGHIFPHCSQCGDAVTFELLAVAPAASNDRNFRHFDQTPQVITANGAKRAA